MKIHNELESKYLYPLGFLLFFLFSNAYAAPYPVTGSSSLTSPARGLFFSLKGFTLGTEGTSWVLQEDHSLSRSEDGTSWRFSSPAANTAQVHLKIDELRTDLSLENYAKRWMRDYGQLGMDVLGTRPFASEGARGIVVDLLQSKKKIQLRQAVFLKGRSAVILTCSDEQSKFNSSLPDCNRLIRNFSWQDVSSRKAF